MDGEVYFDLGQLKWRRHQGGRLVTFRDLAKEISFATRDGKGDGPRFSRWVREPHDPNDPAFQDQLATIAHRLKIREPETADVLLQASPGSQSGLGAATRSPVWAGLRLPDLNPSEVPAAAVTAIVQLVHEVQELKLRDDTSVVHAVDTVFKFFSSPDVRPYLNTIEDVAREVLERHTRDSDRFMPHRVSLERLLVIANEDPHTKLRVGQDDSVASLASFRAGDDLVVLNSRLAGRMLRFELARHIAATLFERNPTLVHMRTMLTNQHGLAPVPDRLNSADDAEWIAQRTHQELCQCLAAALLLPKDHFMQAVVETGADIVELARRYRTSAETVVRRTVSLAELPNSKLPPMHALKVDAAGNLWWQAGSTGVDLLPRRLGACARWAATKAFQTSGITRQWSRFENNNTFFCASVVVTGTGFIRESARFSLTLGCRARDAQFFSYARTYPSKSNWVEVGGACAVCMRVNCEERAVRNVALEQKFMDVTSHTKFNYPRKFNYLDVFTEDDVSNMEQAAQVTATRLAAEEHARQARGKKERQKH